MSSDPKSGLRISDAEREAAVSALGEHFAAGRLTREEYDERSERAYAARTAAEVAPLFTDLPAPHPYAQSAPRAARPAPSPTGSWPSAGWPAYRAPVRRGPRVPLLPLLFIVIGLAVLLKAPFLVFLVLGVVWFAKSRRRGC
jgi:uncharacterized protein DUF1707